MLLLKNTGRHPLDDEYWQDKRPDLSKIVVPALVCGSWSDQGLHTRGSFEGYKTIGSEHKWHYTHGRRKWETFYSPEALDLQEKFFNYFLKGEKNDMMQQPAVRLEVRTGYYQSNIRYDTEWPLRCVHHQKIFLHAATNELLKALPENETFIRYEAVAKRGMNKAVFTYQFDEETELTGGMNLRLWVSAEQTGDME